MVLLSSTFAATIPEWGIWMVMQIRIHWSWYVTTQWECQTKLCNTIQKSRNDTEWWEVFLFLRSGLLAEAANTVMLLENNLITKLEIWIHFNNFRNDLLKNISITLPCLHIELQKELWRNSGHELRAQKIKKDLYEWTTHSSTRWLCETNYYLLLYWMEFLLKISCAECIVLPKMFFSWFQKLSTTLKCLRQMISSKKKETTCSQSVTEKNTLKESWRHFGFW